MVRGECSNDVCYFELLLQKHEKGDEYDILLCFNFDPFSMDLFLQSFFFITRNKFRFDIHKEDVEEYEEPLERVATFVIQTIIQQDPKCRLFFATNEIAMIKSGYFPRIKEDHA